MSRKLELSLEGSESVWEAQKSSGSLGKPWEALELGQRGSMMVTGHNIIVPY